MSFRIDWDKNNVYVKFYGNLSIQDFLDVNGKMYGDSRFDRMDYQIADFTDVDSFSLTDREVNVISTLELSASRWNKCIKVAHVSHFKESKGLTDIYKQKMQQTNWQFKRFDTVREARDWCEE